MGNTMQTARFEEWRPVPGYEGRYQVSDQGQVKSLPRTQRRKNGTAYTVAGRILSPGVDFGRYPLVILYRDGEKATRRIHSLVADAFLPGRGTCVNHIDGDKQNNRATNLERVSHSENSRHAADSGLQPYKLNPASAEEIRVTRTFGATVRSLSEQYGVSKAAVYEVLRGKTWPASNAQADALIASLLLEG